MSATDGEHPWVAADALETDRLHIRFSPLLDYMRHADHPIHVARSNSLKSLHSQLVRRNSKDLFA